MIRRPRVHNEKHLKFVRGLPCCVCGNNIASEAAHVRFACEAVGKRKVGVGEKPDDKWTVPLCGMHHRMQHEWGEREFWKAYGKDPIVIAQALWMWTGDQEAGEGITGARWLERERLKIATKANNRRFNS